MVRERRTARAERSVPAPVASISGRIPSPPIPASLVPSIPIVASAPPAIPIPPVPTAVARSRPRPRPRPRPATIPRSIAFVATAPTPIVTSIVPTSSIVPSIVPSIVSPIGTPRIHRPRRRSPSAERVVALGQPRVQLVAQFPDSFPTDVLFPGDVFRAARFAVRGREQHGAHGARVRRLRHARFRGGYARFHRGAKFLEGF